MVITPQDVVEQFTRISLAYLRAQGFNPLVATYFARGERAALLMTETANCTGSRFCYPILAAALVRVSNLAMLPRDQQPQDDELPIAHVSVHTYNTSPSLRVDSLKVVYHHGE